MTGAITGARTQGAAPKNRWRSRVRTRTPWSSPMKGSTSTSPTLSSLSAHLRMSLHHPRSLKGSAYKKPKTKSTTPHKYKKPRAAHPRLTTARSQPCSPTSRRRTPPRKWVHKGCWKIWCLSWFEIQQTTSLPPRLPPLLTLLLQTHLLLLLARWAILLPTSILVNAIALGE